MTRSRLFFYAFAGLNFVCAGLQLNDPDPTYWVGVYLGTTVVLLFRAHNRQRPLWSGMVIGAVAAGLITAAPGFFGYMGSADYGSIVGSMQERPHIESAREFLGLSGAMVLLLLCLRRAT